MEKEDSATILEMDESSETIVDQNIYNQNLNNQNSNNRDENIHFIPNSEQNRVHNNPFSIHNENIHNNPTYSNFQSQNGLNHINQTMTNHNLLNGNSLRDIQPRIQRINTNNTYKYNIYRSSNDIPLQAILPSELFDNLRDGKAEIVIKRDEIGRVIIDICRRTPRQPIRPPVIPIRPPRPSLVLQPPLVVQQQTRPLQSPARPLQPTRTTQSVQQNTSTQTLRSPQQPTIPKRPSKKPE